MGSLRQATIGRAPTNFIEKGYRAHQVDSPPCLAGRRQSSPTTSHESVETLLSSSGRWYVSRLERPRSLTASQDVTCAFWRHFPNASRYQSKAVPVFFATTFRPVCRKARSYTVQYLIQNSLQTRPQGGKRKVFLADGWDISFRAGSGSAARSISSISASESTRAVAAGAVRPYQAADE